MIDIHNHLVVGVDDGAATEEDAINLMKQAESQGIKGIIATPHHRVFDWYTEVEDVRRHVNALNQIAEENQIDITIYPGQEIHAYGEVLDNIQSGLDMGLNDSKYLLIELPSAEVPFYIDQLFYNIQMKGYIPVIAHPERNKEISQRPSKLTDLVEKGALAQITAGSITGVQGERIQKLSIEMLRTNHAHFVASDAHHVERRPFLMREALDVLKQEGLDDVVDRLLYNAEQIIQNKTIRTLPVEQMSDSVSNRKKKKKKKRFGLF